MLPLMKSNGCTPVLNILHKNLQQSHNYINEMMLTPFSPFDIKSKKINLMQNTSGNVFLGHQGRRVFHIFPRLHSIIGVGMWPQILYKIFVNHVTIFNSSPVQYLRWSSFWQKIGHGWKLLLHRNCYYGKCYYILLLHRASA